MNARKLFISLFAATSMAAAPLAMAEMGRTESTIVGAAAGGLLGNLISKNNSNYTREGYHNNRYYYGGREFRSRRDYNAYREAVRRDMLRDKEARRYQTYSNYRHQKANARGNSRYGHQQWQNGRGHGRSGMARGHGHR